MGHEQGGTSAKFSEGKEVMCNVAISSDISMLSVDYISIQNQSVQCWSYEPSQKAKSFFKEEGRE